MEAKTYLTHLTQVLNTIDDGSFQSLENLIFEVKNSGKTVYIAGNGGSSATASHMVSDLRKTVLNHDYEVKQRVNAVCLSDNTPLLTAWANDYGFEHIFSQQLAGNAVVGDLLIVITASGNSPNIVEAVKMAKSLGLKTFGLLGFDGGTVKGLLDYFILIDSRNYGIVEDAHSVIGHVITEMLKERMG